MKYFIMHMAPRDPDGKIFAVICEKERISKNICSLPHWGIDAKQSISKLKQLNWTFQEITKDQFQCLENLWKYNKPY